MDMNETDRKRLVRSLEIAGCFWFGLALFFILLPEGKIPEAKREFTSVALTLTAPSGGHESAVSAAPSGSAASPGLSGAERKGVTSGAKSAAKGTAGKGSAPKAAARTSSGLGIPDFGPPAASSKQTGGNADYLDFSSPAETVKPRASAQQKSPVAEFEGSAASMQRSSSSGESRNGVSTSGTGKSGQSAASTETSRSLEAIAGSARSGSGGSGTAGGQGGTGTGNGTGSGVGSGTGSGTGTGNGSSSSVGGFAFDGKPRKLLYPAKPSVALPENLARLVDSDRSVTVQFTVRADGTVPAGLVTFMPSAILPAEIRDWLRNEFSRWRFEQSAQDGQARFLYSIKVQ